MLISGAPIGDDFPPIVEAILIGTETWVFVSGSQLALPSSDDFPGPNSGIYDKIFIDNVSPLSHPDGVIFSGGSSTQPIFDTPTGFNIAGSSDSGAYADPDLTSWLYGINDTGFCQFTGTGSLTGLDSGVGAVNVNISYNAGNFITSTISGSVQGYGGGAGNLAVISFWELPVNIISGITTDVMVNTGLVNFNVVPDNSDFVFFESLFDTQGALGYGNLYANCASSYAEVGNTLLITNNGGGAIVNQVSINITAVFGNSIVSGGRYKAVGTDRTNWPTFIHSYFDWLPTIVGNAEDFNSSEIFFDDAALNDYMNIGGIIWFNDASFFYGLLMHDETNTPMQPIIVRVNPEFTEYTLIFTTNDDVATQDLIDGFLASNYQIYGALSYDDDSFILTGGIGADMFYAIAAMLPVTTANTRTTQLSITASIASRFIVPKHPPIKTSQATPLFALIDAPTNEE